MFEQQITELELRKKALLLESGQNRLRLRGEFQQLRSPAAVLESLTGMSGKFGPWALTLSAVVGLIGAAGLRRASRSTGIVGQALALAPVAIRLWRAFRARYGKPH